MPSKGATTTMTSLLFFVATTIEALNKWLLKIEESSIKETLKVILDNFFVLEEILLDEIEYREENKT